MKTKFIEAVSTDIGAFGNHGKFMVAYFEPHEWGLPSVIDLELGHVRSLIARTGWTQDHFFVLDLQTGEGALFKLGGHAHADLTKHKVWVCPLFEPFLDWLYGRWEFFTKTFGKNDNTQQYFLDQLDTRVLFDRPMEMSGYRRPGPDGSDDE